MILRAAFGLFLCAALSAGTAAAKPSKGFYRLEDRGEGRWALIDPEGRETFQRGVVQVKYEGHWCSKLNLSPHWEAMKRRFPVREDWCTNAVGRLKDWGFNALGAQCDRILYHRGLSYTEFLAMGDEWAYSKDENLWICPNEHRPCSAFPNVFHPDWTKHCAEVANRMCAPLKDDAQLFGYFIDNELAWWGRRWDGTGTGLFDEAMKRPEGHAARAAATALAKSQGVDPKGAVPDDVKREFLRQAAERYFAGAADAIRKADPNHLVLGARFAGTGGAHEIVWRAAGRHCDLVTFNCYPWADIDRNIVVNGNWGNAEPVYDVFKRVYDMVGKPLIITEWSFPAFDSGLPCQHGAGQRFQTQAQRAKASELFAKEMLAMPFVVGYDYFMWVDEPPLGITPAFPEDSNYGLIDNDGNAYPELTGMFRTLHSDLKLWREGSVTLAADGSYAVTDGHVAFRGRRGRGRVFSEVSLDGRRYGNFNVQLDVFEEDGGRGWPMVDEIVSVVRKGRSLEIVGAGGGADGRFELALRVSSPDSAGRVVAEVMSIRNLGKRALNVNRILLGAYADFAREATNRSRSVEVWKGMRGMVWVGKDGREFGIETASPLAEHTWYYCSPDGCHPDAFFKPAPGLFPVRPGETASLRDIWASIVVTRGSCK